MPILGIIASTGATSGNIFVGLAIEIDTVPPSVLGIAIEVDNVGDAEFDNVLVLLPFDDNTIIDKSNNNKAFYSGGSTLDTSIKKFGTGSRDWDGGTDRSDGVIYNDADFELQKYGNFTLECWLYPTDSNNGNFFADWISSSAWSYLFTIATGRIPRLTWNDGGAGTNVEGTAITLNDWSFYRFVKQGDNVGLMIDGVNVETGDASSWIADDTTPQPFIGSLGIAPLSSRNYGGKIDQFRITTNHARSNFDANHKVPTEAFPTSATFGVVTPLKDFNPNIIPIGIATELDNIGDEHWDDVITLFPFDVDITDVSSFGKVYTNDGSTLDASEKKFGAGSRDFDGTNDELVAPVGDADYHLVSYTDFTVETWIYMTDSNNGNLFTDHIGASNHSYLVRMLTNRFPQFGWNDNVITRNVTSKTATPLNGWAFVRWIKQGNKFGISIDGVNEVVDITTNWVADDTTPDIYFGGLSIAASSSRNLGAKIDDFRITRNVARSDFDADHEVPTEAFPTSATFGVVTPVKV